MLKLDDLIGKSLERNTFDKLIFVFQIEQCTLFSSCATSPVGQHIFHLETPFGCDSVDPVEAAADYMPVIGTLIDAIKAVARKGQGHHN